MDDCVLPEKVAASSAHIKSSHQFTAIQPPVDDSPPPQDGSDGLRDGLHYHLPLSTCPMLQRHDYSQPTNPSASQPQPPPSPELEPDPIRSWVNEYLANKITLTNDYLHQLIQKVNMDESFSHADKNRLIQKIRSNEFREHRETYNSPQQQDGSDSLCDSIHDQNPLPNFPMLQRHNYSLPAKPSSPEPPPSPEVEPELTRSWVDEYLSKEATLTNDHVRKLIRKVMKDDSFSHTVKNRLIQKIHSHRFTKHREKESEKLKQDLEKERCRPSYSNVIDPDTGEPMMGCEHYPRYCKLKAACCNTWVVCRQCHDRDEMGHTMPRHKTEEVMCMRCGQVQPVSKTCINCHKDFAAYFCPICRFYDNTPGKAIYHCNDCKICRVGKGIGVDNFHCPRCDACVSKDYAENHRCLQKSLDANCPICGQYLYTSTKPVVFMRCGHTMHSHCFDAYTVDNFTCPLCHKTLTNMNTYYRQIDQELERHEMPEEYRDMLSEIFCHDCDRRSVTPYHYVYHKCKYCDSYNTRKLSFFRKGESSRAGESSASGSRDVEILPDEADSDQTATVQISGANPWEGNEAPQPEERKPVGQGDTVRGENSDGMVET